MRKQFFLIICAILMVQIAIGQDKVISRKKFFNADTPIEVVLTTDLKKLASQKKNPAYMPATFTWVDAEDTIDVREKIQIRLRGNNRRENCNLASLMVDFRVEGENSKMKNFKRIKLVAPCSRGFDPEQLVLKEYLIYKLYNLFTDLSFKVRLLHITFEDASGKQKSYKQYGFAIEPTDDLAKRNNCIEEEKKQILQMQTRREHTTMVVLFQYMIGNTDWSVPNYHNVKLLVPKDSPDVAPFIVPYDFDYAGAVNAPYAVPHESLGIEKVTDRFYMGFPRTMEELKPVIEQFQEKREIIRKMIMDWDMLSNAHKKEMAYFIDDFFKMIEKDNEIKVRFIDNARKK